MQTTHFSVAPAKHNGLTAGQRPLSQDRAANDFLLLLLLFRVFSSLGFGPLFLPGVPPVPGFSSVLASVAFSGISVFADVLSSWLAGHEGVSFISISVAFWGSGKIASAFTLPQSPLTAVTIVSLTPSGEALFVSAVPLFFLCAAFGVSEETEVFFLFLPSDFGLLKIREWNIKTPEYDNY